jgi:hypothetical protein
MAKSTLGSKTGNATITRVGHTRGQNYGTSGTTQAPRPQNPTDVKLGK